MQKVGRVLIKWEFINNLCLKSFKNFILRSFFNVKNHWIVLFILGANNQLYYFEIICHFIRRRPNHYYVTNLSYDWSWFEIFETLCREKWRVNCLHIIYRWWTISILTLEGLDKLELHFLCNYQSFTWEIHYLLI